MDALEKAIAMIQDDGEGDDPQFLVYKGVLWDTTKPMTPEQWEVFKELLPEEK